MSNVDHPAHYKRKGRRECIDEMIEIYGPKDVIAFCKLNAFKYEYRADLKGDAEEDLKKAEWYRKKAKEIEIGDMEQYMNKPEDMEP